MVLDNYRGTHDVALHMGSSGGPSSDDRPVIPTYLRYYTVNSPLLFTKAARMVQITRVNETHRDSDGNVSVKSKNINTSSKYA